MLRDRFFKKKFDILASLLIIVLFIPSVLQAELVCAKLKNASPNSQRPTKLVIERTAQATCPSGSIEIIDTAELTGAKGDKGDTGDTGSPGTPGADGDMNILCYARVDMDTDTVTTFGGNGTTSVSAVQGGSINLNTVTCNGTYPGVSSLNDLVLFANQSTNASSPPGPTVVDLSSSSASSSQIVVHVRTSDGDEHYNILVLGPTS